MKFSSVVSQRACISCTSNHDWIIPYHACYMSSTYHLPSVDYFSSSTTWTAQSKKSVIRSFFCWIFLRFIYGHSTVSNTFIRSSFWWENKSFSHTV